MSKVNEAWCKYSLCFEIDPTFRRHGLSRFVLASFGNVRLHFKFGYSSETIDHGTALSM